MEVYSDSLSYLLVSSDNARQQDANQVDRHVDAEQENEGIASEVVFDARAVNEICKYEGHRTEEESRALVKDLEGPLIVKGLVSYHIDEIYQVHQRERYELKGSKTFKSKNDSNHDKTS